MDLIKLGTILRAEREEVGVPAAVLARRAAIGRNTIWVTERGENPLTGKPSRIARDKLERWITSLGLQDQMDELLQLADYPPVPPATRHPTLPPIRKSGLSRRPSLRMASVRHDAPMAGKTVESFIPQIEAIIDASGLAGERKATAEQLIIESARTICHIVGQNSES